MASLQDALSADLTGYSPVNQVAAPASSAPGSELQPVLNPMMRCPLPVLVQTTGDSQRQFYVGGRVPQVRFLAIQPASANSGNTTTTAEVTNVTTSGGGGGSGGSTIATQQSVATTVVNPGGVFRGTITMAKCFQLLGVAASAAARVQLYGTSAAQVQDLARGLDVPPPAGTQQNIICDVVLDTVPLAWAFQNRNGANNDSPQQPLAYLTLTNLSAGSAAITVTFTYVDLEST